MGKPSEEEVDRNAAIVKDKEVLSSSDLVKKYGISRQRIFQIVKRAKNK
jgi:Mor family transcriptional regulator